MQRWLFVNNSGAGSAESNQGSANGQSPVGNDGRLLKLKVSVDQSLEPGEQIAVSGQCLNIGPWLQTQCIPLNRENGSNVWSGDIYIPANKVVRYGYLICTVDPITKNVDVLRWETDINFPRQIFAGDDEATQTDTFGTYDDLCTNLVSIMMQLMKQSNDQHKELMKQSNDQHKELMKHSNDQHKELMKQSNDQHELMKQSNDQHKELMKQLNDQHKELMKQLTRPASWKDTFINHALWVLAIFVPISASQYEDYFKERPYI